MRLLLLFLLLAVPVPAEPPDPGDLAVAVRHFHAQELAAAETLLLGAREAEPESAAVAYYLGRVYLAQGRSQDAVQAIEQATRLDPGSSLHQFWLAEALVARIDEVAVLFKVSVAHRIRVAYEKAVELDPENLEARVAVARYHAEAPPIVGGDPAAAQQQLEEVRRRDPALAHVAQALIHERLGRPEPAEEEIAAAVRVDPESVVGWREAGLFHQRRQRWQEAQRAFDEVLLRQPGDPVALFEAARTAVEISDLQLARAERALAAYLALEPGPMAKVFGAAEAPKREVAHRRLGRVYELRGRPDLAAGQLAAAAGLVPDREARIDFPLVDAALVD